jgi:hypothetical protein
MYRIVQVRLQAYSSYDFGQEIYHRSGDTTDESSYVYRHHTHRLCPQTFPVLKHSPKSRGNERNGRAVFPITHQPLIAVHLYPPSTTQPTACVLASEATSERPFGQLPSVLGFV